MLHEDDIPKLTDKEKKCPDLMVIYRGWVFRFAYGYLWASYPQ